MKLNNKQLHLSAQRGSRLVALSLLDEASESAAPLAASASEGNLHDFRVAVRRLRIWLRAFREEIPDVRKSDLKRLRRCARATNAGRDLEVQIEWLEKAGSRINLRRRRGAHWLCAELREREVDRSGMIQVAIDDNFEPVRTSLSAKLSTYTQAVRPNGADAATLARAIGTRLVPLTQNLAFRLDRIDGLTDEDGCHEARIQVKRLRYLLEPAASRLKGGGQVIAKLRGLQDSLGAVHDLQLLAHLIQQILEESALSMSRRAMGSALGGVIRVAPILGSSGNPTAVFLPNDGSVKPGDLISVARRLRREVDRSFKPVRERWLDGKHQDFTNQVETIALRLMEMQ
jgi:CHAD domain-containing protein